MITEILFGLLFIFVFLLLGILLVLLFPIVLLFWTLAELFARLRAIARGPLTVSELIRKDPKFGSYIIVKDKGTFLEERLPCSFNELGFPIKKEFIVFKSQEGYELLLDKEKYKTTKDGYFIFKGEWRFLPPLDYLSVH